MQFVTWLLDLSLCRICIGLSSNFDCVFTFSDLMIPHVNPHVAGTNTNHTICWMFDLVCEHVLAVSFTCKPRPGEAGGAFLSS